MAKHKNKTSMQTIAEAEAVAKATQRPGQTKEQTKLIAKGIQKGIEEYKKRQKSKARELDKKLRKAKSPSPKNSQVEDVSESAAIDSTGRRSLLPWTLLVISWLFFASYWVWFQS